MRRRQLTTVLCSTGSRTSIATARARGTGPSSQVWPDRTRANKRPMRKQQLRTIVALAIVGLACAARPAHAQYFHVGTFTKPAATGVQTWPHGLPANVT